MKRTRFCVRVCAALFALCAAAALQAQDGWDFSWDGEPQDTAQSPAGDEADDFWGGGDGGGVFDFSLDEPEEPAPEPPQAVTPPPEPAPPPAEAAPPAPLPAPEPAEAAAEEAPPEAADVAEAEEEPEEEFEFVPEEPSKWGAEMPYTLGAFIEGNMLARTGMPLGFGVSIDRHIPGTAKMLLMGVRAGLNASLDGVSATDIELYLRLNMVRINLPQFGGYVFSQVSGGYTRVEEELNYPNAVGINYTLGWRAFFVKGFYAEPFVRVGFPGKFAVGIGAGHWFNF